LVTCDHPQLTDLPRRLLERTLIVRDLATARALSTHTPGYRFVTLSGELLEADSTLTVGVHHAETGLLSRKSELRELREQAAGLDERRAAIERDLDDLVRQAAQGAVAMEEARQQVAALKEQAADLHARVAKDRQQRLNLHEQVEINRGEIDRTEQDIATLE